MAEIPVELKKKRGTYKYREKKRRNLPEVTAGAPKHLDKQSFAVWQRVMDVEGHGLTEVDLPVFEMMCNMYSLYRDAIEAVDSPVEKNKPAGSIIAAIKIAEEYRKLARELGLTPETRRKHIVDQQNRDEMKGYNPFDELKVVK